LQKYGEIKRVFVDELLTLLPQLRIIGFIFLPHIRVYTIIYNDYACVIPYPKYIQEKRIKLAKEHMVDIEEVIFYVLSSPFLAEL
jgi:hypothetical protein